MSRSHGYACHTTFVKLVVAFRISVIALKTWYEDGEHLLGMYIIYNNKFLTHSYTLSSSLKISLNHILLHQITNLIHSISSFQWNKYIFDNKYIFTTNDNRHASQYVSVSNTIFYNGYSNEVVERQQMETPISSSKMIGRVSTFECVLSSRSNEIVTRRGVDSTRVIKVGSGSPYFLVTYCPASKRRPSRFFSFKFAPVSIRFE